MGNPFGEINIDELIDNSISEAFQQQQSAVVGGPQTGAPQVGNAELQQNTNTITGTGDGGTASANGGNSGDVIGAGGPGGDFSQDGGGVNIAFNPNTSGGNFTGVSGAGGNGGFASADSGDAISSVDVDGDARNEQEQNFDQELSSNQQDIDDSVVSEDAEDSIVQDNGSEEPSLAADDLDAFAG